jgi:hypothetical protein
MHTIVQKRFYALAIVCRRQLSHTVEAVDLCAYVLLIFT